MLEKSLSGAGAVFTKALRTRYNQREQKGNTVMVKSEFIEQVAEHYANLPRQQIKAAVEALVAQMSETLAGGERIEIRGFGSFSLHFRVPRTARNPKTGAPVAVAGRYAVHFKPGNALRTRVNDNRKR